jgi:hypothetical protein
MYQTTHRANAAKITPAQYQPRSVSSLIGSSSLFREGLYTHDIIPFMGERGEVGPLWKGDYYLKPRLGRGFLMSAINRLRTHFVLLSGAEPSIASSPSGAFSANRAFRDGHHIGRNHTLTYHSHKWLELPHVAGEAAEAAVPQFQRAGIMLMKTETEAVLKKCRGLIDVH